jgi:hypothetical protein
MAEMCPPQIRGAVVSAKETVIVGGVVVGYAAGNFMSNDPRDWTGEYDSLLLQIFVLITTPSRAHLLFRLVCFQFWILGRFIWCLRFRGSSHVTIDVSNSEK